MPQERTVGFQFIPRPPGGHRTRPGGAVFLLSVYFVAVTLLLLGGISLQRTSVEMRAAHVSRDAQQAFYLAEAGIDAALVTLRASPGCSLTATGTTTAGTYHIQTASTDVIFTEQGTLESICEVTSTGRAALGTVQNIVRVSTRTPLQLTGIQANGQVVIAPRDPFSLNGGSTIEGDVRSAQGLKKTLIMAQNTVIEGDVSIAPPDMTNPEYYDTLVTDYHATPPGGILMEGGAEVTGTIAQQSLAPLPMAPFPSSCGSEPIHVLSQETLEIHDGEYYDRTPAGDGRVQICVPYVYVQDRGKVLVHDPTTIYVTDPAGFSNYGQVDVIGGIRETRADRGLTVVVPPAPKRKTYVNDFGDFTGSVYAPGSYVLFGNGKPSLAKLGFVVAQDLFMMGKFRLNGQESDDVQLSDPALSILHWSN